jgi:hypothetical protein
MVKPYRGRRLKRPSPEEIERRARVERKADLLSAVKAFLTFALSSLFFRRK